MARPLKVIDQVEFEKLCGLQCTKLEICDWFNVTDKTLESWCKRTYGCGFSETFEKKRGKGKIALRRTQFKLAEKSAAMAIFLGKQYLGQADRIITESSADGQLADLIEGLKYDYDIHGKAAQSDAPLADEQTEEN